MKLDGSFRNEIAVDKCKKYIVFGLILRPTISFNAMLVYLNQSIDANIPYSKHFYGWFRQKICGSSWVSMANIIVVATFFFYILKHAIFYGKKLYIPRRITTRITRTTAQVMKTISKFTVIQENHVTFYR